MGMEGLVTDFFWCTGNFHPHTQLHPIHCGRGVRPSYLLLKMGMPAPHTVWGTWLLLQQKALSFRPGAPLNVHLPPSGWWWGEWVKGNSMQGGGPFTSGAPAQEG